MSSTGADTNKGLLLPYFDGDPNKFKGWWMRFKAYATIKNFAPAIDRTKEADLPDTEATDVSSDKSKKAARDRNMMAIACLTASFQDDGLLNMIEQSMTMDWPSGLAYVVVDELFKRYRPVDIISRVEMRTKLNHVSMKAEDDPKTLFDQLASIQSAYNDATRKIDPDDLIAVVLEKAPEQYKSILTAEQRSKGTKLTLAHLRSCMNDLYRTRNPNVTSKNENEVSLAATATKFNGICGYCKKPGHMARDCRKKKSDLNKNDGNKSKTLRPCRHCGGKHMDNKCWELPENAKSRPANWKSKKGNETVAVACDNKSSSQVELLLSNIDEELQTFPNHQDLLLQPNIWIGDSAATVHMSPHEEGMINIKNIRGGITVGNGETMVTKKIGDIPCDICDKK
jgi:gag-polypeptide of LTR copia-type